MIECRQQRCNAPGAEGVGFARIKFVSQAHVQDARNYCHTLDPGMGMSRNIGVRWEFEPGNEGNGFIEETLQDNDLNVGPKPSRISGAARVGVWVAAPGPTPSARLGIHPTKWPWMRCVGFLISPWAALAPWRSSQWIKIARRRGMLCVRVFGTKGEKNAQ